MNNKKIAILSPVAWRTPPRQYGAWETVASNITEGLVKKGWDVTLFATADSITKAKLHAVVDGGYEEDKSKDPKICEYHHLGETFEHADQFDLIHSHYDFMALTYSQLIKTPMLTTIHGFSSPKIMPLYQKYNGKTHYVSISNSDREPSLDYLATVYNGIDISQSTFRPNIGDTLVWLGRIHPDKGVHLAIETAKKSGRPLIMAGIIQDKTYYEEKVLPHINNETIKFIGPVGAKERDELFSNCYCLLHLNTLPERFGLIMAEANACGIPVVAMDRGSCREVIADKTTGFLVNDVDEAVDVLAEIPKIDRSNCKKRVEQNFTVECMVSAYEKVYNKIFQLNQ